MEREQRLQRLLRAWWLDERPSWTDADWWEAPLLDQIRGLLWLPAGPLLAEAVAAAGRGATCPSPHVGESPPGSAAPGHAAGVPCACQVVVAAAWEACSAWCAAGAAVALVDAVGPRPVSIEVPMSGQLIDPAREELARALRLTPHAMGTRIKASRDLVGHPQLVDLVSSAGISAWAARLVVLEVADLTEEQSREVVSDVCQKVSRRLASGRRAWTSAEVGRAARLSRRRVCPEGDLGARERAFAQRRVQVFPDHNGMATLVAELEATDAHRIHRRLSAIANGLADPLEPRTRDQLRADILVDLLLSAGPVGHPGAPSGVGAPRDAHGERDELADLGGRSNARGRVGPDGREAGSRSRTSVAAASADHARPVGGHQVIRGPRPDIQVIVTIETLIGLADDPAEIPGMGPIPAAVARELAADGRWSAWVADASGAIVATGTRGYVPSASLARLVRAREPYCRMPGCRQAAAGCDLDHAVPYPKGSTCAENLGPLCRRHHVMKTHLNWQLSPTTHPGNPADGVTAKSAQGNGQPEPALARGRAQQQDAPVAWRWRTPAGFTIVDYPEHPLE